jgi:hypothetical protein
MAKIHGKDHQVFKINLIIGGGRTIGTGNITDLIPVVIRRGSAIGHSKDHQVFKVYHPIRRTIIGTAEVTGD